MTRTNQNFELWAGDDREVIFQVTDKLTGSGKQLDGMTATWGLFAETTNASVLRLDGAISGSLVTVTLTACHTGSLNGYYNHELQVVDAASHVATLATGLMRVYASLVS